MQGVLIDLDGVIYEGGNGVPGAPEALAWLAANRVPHLFLTNTTSKPRSAIVDKLAALGIPTHPECILTPPVAAKRWLKHTNARAALFVPEATVCEFDAATIADTCGAASVEAVSAVVIGDYGERWSFSELNRAFRLLMADPQPALIALGMTRYWLADDGLRLDAGTFATALGFAAGVEPVVMGKPGPTFFATALEMLGAPAEAVAMIGDDIRTDVGGAQACGLRGILVRTGKFRPSDERADVTPDAVLDSIADLPQWLERH